MIPFILFAVTLGLVITYGAMAYGLITETDEHPVEWRIVFRGRGCE